MTLRTVIRIAKGNSPIIKNGKNIATITDSSSQGKLVGKVIKSLKNKVLMLLAIDSQE